MILFIAAAFCRRRQNHGNVTKAPRVVFIIVQKDKFLATTSWTWLFSDRLLSRSVNGRLFYTVDP